MSKTSVAFETHLAEQMQHLSFLRRIEKPVSINRDSKDDQSKNDTEITW